MIETVVLAIDPAEERTDIPAYAYSFMTEAGGTIHAVAVLEGAAQRDQIRMDREQEARDSVSALLETQGTASTVETEIDVREGVPAEQIIAAIEDVSADLVVMGTRGPSGLDRLLLGSVAESVVTESPVPVLTIPPTSED